MGLRRPEDDVAHALLRLGKKSFAAHGPRHLRCISLICNRGAFRSLTLRWRVHTRMNAQIDSATLCSQERRAPQPMSR
jgi:hypothetical protein